MRSLKVGCPRGEEPLGCGSVELDLIYHYESTLALLVSTVAAQETKDEQHSTSCDEEIAHVGQLCEILRQRPEDLQEGAPVDRYPDAHS